MKKQENKEIIGYKLIDDTKLTNVNYIVSLEMGTTIYDNVKKSKIGGYCVRGNPGSIKALKKAGVLDIWFTPIYKEEPKFEVGKWYRNDIGEYSKFYQLENTQFLATEHIFKTPRRFEKSSSPIGYGWIFRLESNPQLLTDLSEIQEYLPDGHPDKIIKEFVSAPNWWIAVTEENKDVLSKWRSSTLSVGKLCGMCKWNTGEIIKGHNPINRVSSSSYSFGNEITFEQFKKYVLKEVDWTKATKEEILAEAKRRYPLLSVIKGLCGETFTLRGYELQYSNHTRILKASDRDAQYLYKDYKWAEIIEQPKKAPYTPGMRTPDIGPYYGKTELFSKEQLEVINKMIDDKVKELQ